MKNFKTYIILFIIFLFAFIIQPSCKNAENQKPINFKTLQKIAEDNFLVGMTVLGYRDGVRFVYNYGYADIDRSIKVDDKTIFFTASISKMITGIALMKLIESGKIKSIDDDISTYLGYTVRNPHYSIIPIKLRHLITHTSGISDDGVSYNFISASYSPNPPSMKELLSITGSYYNEDVWLKAVPGSKFKYSNFGTILAGAIAGKVSGKRFDEFVNDEILKPLGMRGGFSIQDIKNISKIAVVYRLDDNRDPFISAEYYNGKRPPPIDLSEYIPGSNPTRLGPHGGLRARVSGLAKIMEIFINKGVYRNGDDYVRILNESSVEEMLKTHWKGFGFEGLYRRKGLFMHITDDLIPGLRMYGHIGDAMGLLSAMYFNPRRNFGILFITNGGYHQKGSSGFYRIEEQVFRESYKLLFE